MTSQTPVQQRDMKCEICNKTAAKNKIVCSDECQTIRLAMFALGDKYFPHSGCSNCWGDLGQGCTEECKKEFQSSLEFGKDLWSLVRLIRPQ